MKTQVVGVRFTPEEKKLIEKVAQEEYINISAFIRRATLEYVNKK